MDKKEATLSVYDFDGTLFPGDSPFAFWRYLAIRRPWILLLIPYYIVVILLYAIRIVPFTTLKQQLFLFVRGIPIETMIRLVHRFWDKSRKKIFPWVEETMKKQSEAGHTLICISASPRYLLEPIAFELGFHCLICTEYVEKDGKISNRLSSPNCKGEEKVRRLNQWAQSMGVNYRIENFYSDHLSDTPLFKLAKNRYLVKSGKARRLEDNEIR